MANKVSINSIDKFLKHIDISTRTVELEMGESKLEFEVKTYLPFPDFINMVRGAINAMFTVDEDTGIEEYHPEYEQIVKANAKLFYVANFKPETSAERIQQLVCCTDVIKKIEDVWNDEQYWAFMNAFDSGVEARKQENLSNERARLNKMSEQMDKAISSFEKVVQAFQGITPETMQHVIDITTGMDEERLANAVVDARDEDFVEQRREAMRLV